MRGSSRAPSGFDGGLLLCGSSLQLNVKPAAKEPVQPLPSVPTRRRPSFTSRSVLERTPATTRPLLIVSAGSSAASDDARAQLSASTGTHRPSYYTSQLGPGATKALQQRDLVAPAAAPAQAWGASPVTTAAPMYISNYSPAGHMSPPASLKTRPPPPRPSASAGNETETGGLQGGPHGAAASASATVTPLPPDCSDAAACEAHRLKAVRRLREQRERREREEEEERERVSEAKAQKLAKQSEDKEAGERREQHRAEVLAINRLLAERDEKAYQEFASSRQDERAAIDKRHEDEDKAKRTQLAETQAKAEARLRAREAEAKKERLRVAAEAEAEKRRKSDLRDEKSKKEEDRELWRAQVYAINKLLAAKDAEAFTEFKRARGGNLPLPQWEGTGDADAAGEDELGEGHETAAAAASGGRAKRKAALASSSGISSEKAALSQSMGSMRSSGGKSGGSVSGSGDSFVSAKFGAALNRTWGAGGSVVSGSGGTPSGGDAGGLSSRSAMAGLGGASAEDRDAAMLKRLSRARESDSMMDLAEELRKRGKGGTYRQQQQREEEARTARREKAREESRIKEEEREVTRSQIYAINKLMRNKEEMAFAEFRLQREAAALDGTGPPSPAVEGARSEDATSEDGPSSDSENTLKEADGKEEPRMVAALSPNRGGTLGSPTVAAAAAF